MTVATITTATAATLDAASFAEFIANELILFTDGQAPARLVGLRDETQLSSWVRAAL